MSDEWGRPPMPPRDDTGAQVRFTTDRVSWDALPDGKRSRLRRLLIDLDIAAAHLRSSVDATAMRDLRSAVAALGTALDLGVEPRVEACRACGHLGMAGATVCGFCWTARRPAD
jgi:hypothetical protein